MFHMLHIIFR